MEEIDDWRGRPDKSVPRRCCCGGLLGVAGSDALGGGWRGGGDMGLGLVETRFCSRWGRNDATVGDLDGVGRGGGASHLCSPSSVSGTGWLQSEHLTVGRSWEIRGSWALGASNEAMVGGL